MADKTIYLKMGAKVKISTEVIRVGDLGKLYCEDSTVINKIKTLKVYRFREQDKNRCVIGLLKVIELIQKDYPEYAINSVGETECIVEHRKKEKGHGWTNVIKIVIVSALFFYAQQYILSRLHY